jgi:hypothetical protein
LAKQLVVRYAIRDLASRDVTLAARLLRDEGLINARRCAPFQLSDCNDGGSDLPQHRLHSYERYELMVGFYI